MLYTLLSLTLLLYSHSANFRSFLTPFLTPTCQTFYYLERKCLDANNFYYQNSVRLILYILIRVCLLHTKIL